MTPDPETLVRDEARIPLPPFPEQVLAFLGTPTDAADVFGRPQRAIDGIRVMIPADPIVGGVVAQRVRGMKQAGGDDLDLMRHFCQFPRADRFSVVAFERQRLHRVAAFCTVGWRLERDMDADPGEPDHDPAGYTLTLDLEMVFVDAGLRGQGYARVFEHVVGFWMRDLMMGIDRRATKDRQRCRLGVTLTALSRDRPGHAYLERLVAALAANLESFARQKRFTAIEIREVAEDIAMTA